MSCSTSFQICDQVSKRINVFFYKHMKFLIHARLCLAIYDFEARIMHSLCLTFQGTRLPV